VENIAILRLSLQGEDIEGLVAHFFKNIAKESPELSSSILGDHAQRMERDICQGLRFLAEQADNSEKTLSFLSTISHQLSKLDPRLSSFLAASLLKTLKERRGKKWTAEMNAAWSVIISGLLTPSPSQRRSASPYAA
jgi:hemoglobin-like flavoprotein